MEEKARIIRNTTLLTITHVLKYNVDGVFGYNIKENEDQIIDFPSLCCPSLVNEGYDMTPLHNYMNVNKIPIPLPLP